MLKLLKIALTVAFLFGIVGVANARLADDTGPVRYKGESERTDAGIQSLLVHDVGNVRMTLSNWGEQGNPDGVPGYFGFEFPLGAETDFLFSSGIWVGAIVNNQRLVSTGTDGDNGTNEFAPTIDEYIATSKQYSELAGREYTMGAKEITAQASYVVVIKHPFVDKTTTLYFRPTSSVSKHDRSF